MPLEEHDAEDPVEVDDAAADDCRGPDAHTGQSPVMPTSLLRIVLASASGTGELSRPPVNTGLTSTTWLM